MKILILGGAGYIGSTLSPYLHEQGHEVTILDSLLYEHITRDFGHAKFIKGDIRNINDLLPAITNADAVVNLAALSNDTTADLQPSVTWETNYKANELIAELCRVLRKRVIYASSCSVYGFAESGVFSEDSRLNPVTLYAQTKMLSEKYYLEDGVDAIILRFATVYGYTTKPRFELVVNAMIGTSFFDKKILVNGGEQWRPLVHVKDVARAIYLSIIAENPRYRVLNVGSNAQNFKIADLGNLIGSNLKDIEVIHNTESLDTRSYQADFSRIEWQLGFKAEYTIEHAIE